MREIWLQGVQAIVERQQSMPSEDDDDPLFPEVSGVPKAGLNSKLHTVCDGHGRPLVMLQSEGQMSDYNGAPLMLAALL